LNKRAAFLLEHRKFLDDLLGSTEEAWIEDGKVYCIVRFADLPVAIWSGRCSGSTFPSDARSATRLSPAGRSRVRGSKAYVVDAWRAYEVSAAVVVDGADAHAGMVHRPFAEFVNCRRNAALDG
jgi:hypothetical protein